MIRFLPDTLRDALLRPLAMVASNANVYVEIAAPDIRFALILVLGLLVALLAVRKRLAFTPFGALCLWFVATFAVWMATSGNGRYFMASLLIAGPVCIALVARLPGSAFVRLSIAVTVVTIQGWVAYESDPWGWWGLAPWDDRPFFEMALDDEARKEPATYVTISNISYSLLAPRFPESSRWANVAALPDLTNAGVEGQRMQKLLTGSKNLRLLVPTRPKYVQDDGMPSPELRTVINDTLVGQRLALATPLRCRLLHAPGLARAALKDADKVSASIRDKFGFWICDLRYPVAPPPPQKNGNEEINAVFDMIEQQCPRFYEPGQKGAARVDGGWVRMYPQSDVRLYLLDDGVVYYKYWRALNPVSLGKADAIRQGAKVPCETMRGRTGMPWERDI